MAQTLLLEQVRALIHYDAATGEFRRLTTYKGAAVGPLGWLEHDGYRVAHVGGRRCKLHQLAWFYVHGEWPAAVDHINGDPSDNRIDNLRPATQAQNTRNRRAKGGRRHKGISFEDGRWRAQITHEGRRIHLGRFDTPEQAGAAYEAKAAELFGAFAKHLSPGKIRGKKAGNLGDS